MSIIRSIIEQNYREYNKCNLHHQLFNHNIAEKLVIKLSLMKKDGSQGKRKKNKTQENENTAVHEQLKTHKGKISLKSQLSDFVAAFGAGGGRKGGSCSYSGQQKFQGYFSLVCTS